MVKLIVALLLLNCVLWPWFIFVRKRERDAEIRTMRKLAEQRQNAAKQQSAEQRSKVDQEAEERLRRKRREAEREARIRQKEEKEAHRNKVSPDSPFMKEMIHAGLRWRIRQTLGGKENWYLGGLGLTDESGDPRTGCDLARTEVYHLADDETVERVTNPVSFGLWRHDPETHKTELILERQAGTKYTVQSLAGPTQWRPERDIGKYQYNPAAELLENGEEQRAYYLFPVDGTPKGRGPLRVCVEGSGYTVEYELEYCSTE